MWIEYLYKCPQTLKGFLEGNLDQNIVGKMDKQFQSDVYLTSILKYIYLILTTKNPSH